MIDYFHYLQIYSPMIIFFSVILFIFMIPYILNNTEFGKAINIEIKQHEELLENQTRIARTSLDCKELQANNLQLLSQGANDKDWFPGISDTNLRIGKERYDTLGCDKN